MGWSTDTVIALNTKFVELIKKSEVGAKYSGFIKAIQKKDKAATALHSEGFLYRKSKQEVYQRIYTDLPDGYGYVRKE